MDFVDRYIDRYIEMTRFCLEDEEGKDPALSEDKYDLDYTYKVTILHHHMPGQSLQH